MKLFGSTRRLVSESVEEATRSGWLLKRGHLNQSLRQRFFTLHAPHGLVSYFESEDAASKGRAKGQVKVLSVAHARPSDAPELSAEQLPLAFCFDSTDGVRYVLLAESVAEKVEWMRALEEAGRGGVRFFQPVASHLAQFIADEEGKSHFGWEGAAAGAGLLAAGEEEAARVEFERVVSDAAEGSEGVARWAVVYAQNELGRMWVARRSWDVALALYEGALRNAPEQCKHQLLLQVAWCKWHMGQYEEASQLYEERLAADPFSPQVLLDRARMRLEMGEYAPCLGDLRQAMALGADAADVRNDCGVCHFERGQVEEALACFAEALAIDADFAPAVTNRGNCLRAQGKLEEAEADFSRAIELEGGRNEKSFVNRGVLALQRHDEARALADLQHALRLKPSSAVALRHLFSLGVDLQTAAAYGGWLHKRGQVNISLQRRYVLLHGAKLSWYDGEEAARHGSHKGEAIVSAAGRASRADAPEMAEETLASAFRVECSLPVARTIVFVAPSLAHKFEWLKQLLAVCERRAFVGVRECLRPHVDGVAKGWEKAAEGAALLRRGDEPAAVAALLAVPPPPSLRRDARPAGAQTEEGRARLAYETALDAEVRWPWGYAQWEMAQLACGRRQWEAALEHLQRAAEATPAACGQQLRLQTAWAAWQLGRKGEAEKLWDGVLAEDPCCWQAMLDRGRCNLEARRYALALLDLEQVAVLGHASADVWNDCGVCHFELGHAADARERFGCALKADPALANALANRANCLCKEGRLREAEEDYSRAIELEPTHAKALAGRGKLLEAQAKYARALADFRRAAALDPSDELARAKVDELLPKAQEYGAADATQRTSGGAAAPRGGGRERATSTLSALSAGVQSTKL
ncbi:hypothetical protein AB1Y20_012772 [Prymnesium parvum]|uniref:PH domain-containing protein n=1 Tax=Prymnesium parvum TaxID=97485 RepID=A0AB34IMB6_PRYPA